MKLFNALQLASQFNINPLTTNDDYSRHRNSAARYQLAQSVLLWLVVNGGCCNWLQKGPSQHWMACSAFLCKRAQKTVLSHCRGSISGFLGSFQSGGAFLGRKAQTIDRSVMSGCGQGHEPAKKLLNEAVDQVFWANSRQTSGNTRPLGKLIYKGLKKHLSQPPQILLLI